MSEEREVIEKLIECIANLSRSVLSLEDYMTDEFKLSDNGLDLSSKIDELYTQYSPAVNGCSKNGSLKSIKRYLEESTKGYE